MTELFGGVYAGKKVLLTGHTGFKGSWMAEWLIQMDAEVYGLALDPDPFQPLFDQLQLNTKLKQDIRCDIRDAEAVFGHVARIKPDFLFHLAAQPLVRLSYEIPIETFSVNVMGTAHLLEAVKRTGHDCTVVVITTDKCYENREWLHAYREEDAMGGYDPYSASKGAAELVVASYRRSFFSHSRAKVRLASARAGNVIGGGDWAQDRIVPDVMRALQRNESVKVRNKNATRPWQHVLEPISGYLWLAAALDNPQLHQRKTTKVFESAFNFGPSLTSNHPVSTLVEALLNELDRGNWVDASDPNAPHEASKLNLATDKAFHLLGWQPVWDFSDTIHHTARWFDYVLFHGRSPCQTTEQQIKQYVSDAFVKALPWTSNKIKKNSTA